MYLFEIRQLEYVHYTFAKFKVLLVEGNFCNHKNTEKRDIRNGISTRSAFKDMTKKRMPKQMETTRDGFTHFICGV